MKRRLFIAGATIACAGSILSCSTSRTQVANDSSPKVGFLTRADTLAALRPPKRRRPLVAILADNNGSETTDLIVPWSILKRSESVDVVIVSTQPGSVQLMPALKIQPDMTLDQFDATYEAGADYVIVPALHDPKNPTVLDWVLEQSIEGAIVAAICSGALVLAHAGLLADRSATTHWYDRSKLRRISPTTRLQLNTRYLADRAVATTTGVSASLPFALTLVEAISGRVRADQIAAAIGLGSFGPEHDSAGYQLKAQNVLRLVSNMASRHEQLGIQIDSELDALELAFIADAWSRTYRSAVSTFSDDRTDTVALSGGLRVVPDLATKEGSALQRVPRYDGLPAGALTFALDAISQRYGVQTANLVALQLEYDWGA